jgi:hypothetical protein
MRFSELEKTENGETLENLVNSSAEGAKGIPLISQAKGQGSINKTVFLFRWRKDCSHNSGKSYSRASRRKRACHQSEVAENPLLRAGLFPRKI